MASTEKHADIGMRKHDLDGGLLEALHRAAVRHVTRMSCRSAVRTGLPELGFGAHVSVGCSIPKTHETHRMVERLRHYAEVAHDLRWAKG